MGIKDMLQNMHENKQADKEMVRNMQQQQRIEEILENRKKSANERELERYMKENREKAIKSQLEIVRKQRDREINFEHNPLKVKNVISGGKWNILKEKNLFSSKGNIFTGMPLVHKSNSRLLRNNPSLYGI